MSEIEVQVRPSGLAGSHRGKWGKATYIGEDSRGEGVYRVVFGGPNSEMSAKFRASDLYFPDAEMAWWENY